MSLIKYRLLILSILLIFGTSAVFAGTSILNSSVFGISDISLDGLAGASRVYTEKFGYARGETVIISGEGFGEFEQVSLSVENYNDSFEQNIILAQWDVYADAKGRFVTNIPIDSLGSTDGRYILKAFGAETKTSAETSFSEILLAESANLDQCANGGIGDPVEPCSGSAWVNGNVNASKAHWVEGQSVAYRQILSGFTVGSTGNTVTIGYDTTKGGLHALDYLTSFDRTETLADGNNPCSGVTGCSLGTFTTYAIPTDVNVTNGENQVPGGGDDITQIPGVFTLFGGTITNVSGYTRTGSYAGDSHASITITFTANSTNMVLAWGGHIATRADWGANNSAVFISGSPYHMNQDACSFGCGSQDRALSASAVIAPADLTIIKDAQPNSPLTFNFTANGNGLVNDMFSLVDNGVVGPDRKQYTGFTNFGAGNEVTIVETGSNGGFSLVSRTCVSNCNGGTCTNNTTLVTNGIRVTFEPGESVTCTFVNAVPTAASVSVSGSTMDAAGMPLARTRVTIQNTTTFETRTTYTNNFGRYQFDGMVVGDFYIVTVYNRKYAFNPDSQSFVLNDAIENLDFTATTP